MPTIGGVFVPDYMMPRPAVPEAERPSLGSIAAASAEGAIGRLRFGLPYQARRLAGTLTQADEERYQQGLAAANEASARAAPASLEDVTSGRVGIGRFAAENLASSLPYMAGSLGGAVAGSVVGGPVGGVIGAVAGGVPQFSAENVGRAVEEQGALSLDAAGRSLAAAVPQAASDALVERFLPGAGRLFGGFAARQSGGFLRRTAASVAKAAGTEAVTEAGQQFGERYAAGVPLGDADAAGEYVNAAVTAFVVGGVLGAGGGFRRTNAVGKPAADTTNTDLNEHTDGILGSLGSALPGMGEQQLGLDLSGGATGEQQLGLALAPEPEVQAPLPPSQLPQIPGLFPALSTLPPDTQLNLGDMFEDNVSPVDPAAIGGTRVTPETEAALQQAMRPAPEIPAGSRPSALAMSGLPGGDLDIRGLPPTDRPFQQVDLEDLQRAQKAAQRSKNVDPDLVTAIDAEMDLRQREDPFLGVRMNQDIAKLRGKSPEEIHAGVTTLLENGDNRSGTFQLAERLGIDPNEPGAALPVVASETAAPPATASTPASVESAPAVAPAPAPAMQQPSAAPDPAFAQEWEGIKRTAGIQRKRSGSELLSLTPANRQEAESRVVRALADVDSFGPDVSQVESVAKAMGLVTNDANMDITPLGRQAYLRSPEGLEDTVAAATQQGYTGAQAANFDRGVRAVSANEAAPQFSNFEDMAAYEAGRVWATNFVTTPDVQTTAQTQTTMARNDTRQNARGIDRATFASRRELSPEQVQVQASNNLISAADLRGVSDSDVAQLRRMARDGVPPVEIGRALEQVQQGRTLFEQPETTPTPLSPPPTRGQPRFREMFEPAENTPAKQAQRVESEAAVQAYDLRNLIQMALGEKALTEKRAQRLNDMLDRGDVAAVRRALKSFDPDAQAQAAEGSFQTPTSGEADVSLEQWLTGQDFMGALNHLADHAPSVAQREIMKRIRTAAQRMQQAGIQLNFQIVRPGDMVPRALLGTRTRALTMATKEPPTATVYLKSVDLGDNAGMNYQIASHEMAHAVTLMLTRYGNRTDVSGRTKVGKAVKDLYDLANGIVNHFNERIKEGNLTPFEQKIFSRDINALQDVDEVLAWGLTNPDMQRYLQTIEYTPRQSVFSRLVDLVRELLGLDGKYNTALTELLRVSEQIMDADATEIRAAYGMNDPDMGEMAPLQASLSEAGIGAANRTVDAANEVTQGLAGTVERAVARLNPQNTGVRFRRTILGWESVNQIVRQFGDAVAGVVGYRDAHRERTAALGRFQQLGTQAYQTFSKLEQAAPKTAARVGQLMRLVSEFQLDPAKRWEDHTWLADDPNASALKKLHSDAVKIMNDLRRGDAAGWEAYQNFRQLNEAQNFARLATDLHSLVAMDPELSLGIDQSWVNPTDQFLRTVNSTDAKVVRDWWEQMLDDQVARAMAFVTAKKGEAARGTERDQQAMSQHLSPIEMRISSVMEAKQAMGRAPYFHLGRFGDWFGSAVIGKGVDGRVDPAKQRVVADALEAAGFSDAQLSADSTKPRFMLRFETKDQTDRFSALMLDLLKRGVLEDEPIKAGPRTRNDNFGVLDGMPEYVRSYIAALEASPVYVPGPNATPEEKAALAAQKDKAIQLARDTWIEAQPDNAISKVLTRRYNVPGYNPDMIRNWAHRWNVGSVNLANVSSAPKFAKAFTDMRAQYNDALVVNRRDAEGNLLPQSDPSVVADVMAELKRRDAKTPVDETADTFDKVRAATHSYFLGFSPAYGLINLTQLGVVALPELAKLHGYTKSFHAMRRASTQALAIVRAVGSEAGKLSWKNLGDVAITEDVLQKAKIDDKTRAFVREMLATGSIDIGTMARALGQVANNQGAGGALDTYLKLSSSIGLYTETFSRLVAALAARDLHGDRPGATEYATNVVSEAMFDYQNWNTGRKLGKRGFLGPVTPILTQFLSYSVQLTEKLYSEAADAIGRARPGESVEAAKARRAASQRFLMGHMAAVTALAGTLGLPFATVFATVFERMAEAFGDDEPVDATAAYRDFLASVFGKDVAEVVARGLPRALGFDISQRAGEQNLLPFSEFIADRRSWQEAVSNTAGRSLGAAPSMFVNILDGGERMLSGDLLGGMKAILPVAYKSPIEAYRMTSEGYVDTKGNKLPLTPGARDVMWQLMGFAPAAKAEYGEARQDQAVRRGEIQRRAQVLRQRVVQAVLAGDQENARALVSRAIEFDRANPAFAVVPGLTSAIQRQAQARANAQALRTPLGVPLNDIAGQRLTRYANID